MKYRSNPNNSTGTLSPEALGTFSKITQMASGRSQLLLATNTSQVLTLTSKFTDRILLFLWRFKEMKEKKKTRRGRSFDWKTFLKMKSFFSLKWKTQWQRRRPVWYFFFLKVKSDGPAAGRDTWEHFLAYNFVGVQTNQVCLCRTPPHGNIEIHHLFILHASPSLSTRK